MAKGPRLKCLAGYSSLSWRHVTIEPVTVRLRHGADAAEATDYLVATSIARRVLETIPDATRAAAITAVTETLPDHQGADGVHLHAGIHLIGASR